MKKTYIQPNVEVMNVKVQESLLQVSINNKEINGNHAGLSREDQGWGAWDDDDF